MTPVENVQGQESLEARLLQIWSEGVAEDQTVEESFGPYESWLLPMGAHQLLLHPVLKEWLYLDPLHDTWERTGYGPGEVVFTVQDGRLGARKKGAGGEAAPLEDVPAEEPPVSTKEIPACPRCQAPVDAADFFCPRCGAPLHTTQPQEEAPPEVIVCPSCGHHNAAEANFCPHCGTKLDQDSSEETPAGRAAVL